MNTNTSTELERWQRHAVRLALILQAVLPRGADDFADACEGAKYALAETRDMGLDCEVLLRPTMRVLVGVDLMEQMLNLPNEVRWADVISSPCGP